MTKLHNIKGPEEHSEKRRGPGTAIVVLCALLSGIGLAIGFGVGGQGSGPPPFSQMALKLTAKLGNIDLKAPQVLEPVQQVLRPMQHALAPMQHVLGPVQHALEPVQRALSPMHLGLWPDWMLNLDQGTRFKSWGAVASSAPRIALVIDDLGPDVDRTKQAIAL